MLVRPDLPISFPFNIYLCDRLPPPFYADLQKHDGGAFDLVRLLGLD